jgi:hypothetical protein
MEVLSVGATRVRVADALTGYRWLWEDDSLEVPINPEEFYVVAVEANGNLTLAHRVDSRLLLFAQTTPSPALPRWPAARHTRYTPSTRFPIRRPG